MHTFVTREKLGKHTVDVRKTHVLGSPLIGMTKTRTPCGEWNVWRTTLRTCSTTSDGRTR
eukprot:7491293-Lingulodinium_polyedra.AAC.1